jgi:hypothetical protein
VDQDTRERHTARCYSLWAAATNYRRYTADMSTADKTKAAADQVKTVALTLTANLLLIAVVLLAGLTGFYLLLDWNQWAAAVLAIAVGCAADDYATPVLSRMFAPAVGAGTDTDKTEANV